MLKYPSKLTLPLLAITLAPSQAMAFDFGFVRVPDYLDPIFIFLVVAAIPVWFAVLLTKPKGIPFKELYRTRMDPLPQTYFRILQVISLGTIALLFVGMGLARMADSAGV